MLKLKVGQVMTRGFEAALGKMMQEPLSGQLAYKLAKIAKKADEEAKLARDAYKKLADRLCVKDDKGELILTNGEPTPTEENKETFAKELQDIFNQEFTIDVAPINPFEITSLTKAQISAVTLLDLDMLMQQPTPPAEPSSP